MKNNRLINYKIHEGVLTIKWEVKLSKNLYQIKTQRVTGEVALFYYELLRAEFGRREFLDLTLPTQSPINHNKLSKQNEVVFNHLMSGQKIDRLIADRKYGICALHSRISDLNNTHKMKGNIIAKLKTVTDRFGNETKAAEYWMEEKSINEMKKKFAA